MRRIPEQERQVKSGIGICKRSQIAGIAKRHINRPHRQAFNQICFISQLTGGWSEVYTAIQNGTVDGVSVSIPSMYTANIQEVAP